MTAFSNRPSELGAPGVYGYPLSFGFAGLYQRTDDDPNEADYNVLTPAKLEPEATLSLLLFCSDAPQVLTQFEVRGDCYQGTTLVAKGLTATGFGRLTGVPEDLTNVAAVKQPNGIGDICSVNINNVGVVPAYHCVIDVPLALACLDAANGSARVAFGYVNLNASSAYPAGEAFGVQTDGQTTSYHLPIVLAAQHYSADILAANNIVTYGDYTYRVVGVYDVD